MFTLHYPLAPGWARFNHDHPHGSGVKAPHARPQATGYSIRRLRTCCSLFPVSFVVYLTKCRVCWMARDQRC